MKSTIKQLSPIWLLKILIRLRALAKGKWPLALAQKSLAKKANSHNLSGKILRKMAYDRDPLLTIFADKYLVRDYVEKRVGEKYLTRLIAQSNSVDFLKEVKLPKNFALKSNNASGGMILVWENAPSQNRLAATDKNIWSRHLIKPEHFRREIAQVIAKRWLSNNYYFEPGRFPEWAYKDIPPLLIVEELVFDANGELPTDFKFFMIDGQCAFIQVDTERFDGHKRDLFLPSWEKIQGTLQHSQSQKKIAKPKFLNEMLEVAQKLTAGVDFVRVDLYETAQGVKFGEMTNYPGAGGEKFDPESLDSELGKSWTPKY